MIEKSTFKPAWWLPNAHLQTLWPVVARASVKINLKTERISLYDDDFLDLHWGKDNNGPIVLILHGLAGSYKSHYIRGLVRELHKTNAFPVVMSFRGASHEPNRYARSYHSGETNDMAYVTRLIQTRFPGRPVYAIGYSLGANALLKWLGESGAGNPLAGAAAVCAPLVLEKACKHMLKAKFSRFYQWRLLRDLKKNLKHKHELTPLPVNMQEVTNSKSFWEFDDAYTAPVHGFKDAQDYYDQSSARQYLKGIDKPTLIVHASDDPFMDESVVPTADELSNTISFELSPTGGHVGFVGGILPGMSNYWLESRLRQFIQDQHGQHYSINPTSTPSESHVYP